MLRNEDSTTKITSKHSKILGNEAQGTTRGKIESVMLKMGDRKLGFHGIVMIQMHSVSLETTCLPHTLKQTFK